LRKNLSQAYSSGFNGYAGLSLFKTRHADVLSLFSKRLIDTNRSDAHFLLDFWEVDPEYRNNKLYILAVTQGITYSDNFEFIAVYEYEPGLNFITDIAGIRYTGFDLSKLSVGDELCYEREKGNPHDKYAVRTLFGGEEIGYIKKGHNEVFQKDSDGKIRLKVKDVRSADENSQLFVRVFLPK
jgi:hypothetical protein